MALTFTIKSVEEITQVKGQHHVFGGDTNLNPLVSYQPNKTLVIIGRVAAANNTVSNWHIESLPVTPPPKKANYDTQGVRIYFKPKPIAEKSSTGSNYRFELQVSDFGKSEVHLTVGVDGNIFTEEPTRKTKVIVVG